MEILIRDRNYANVRLPDGTEGWVKAAYLVDEKPAKLIVTETLAERDRLADELAEAREAFAEPAAVIVEILNEDGTMARRPDLEKFAAEHDLKIGTIADLIQYRIKNEKTVELVTSCNLPTDHGEFRLVAYQDVIGGEMHLALVKGKISADEPTLVRVHVQNTLCDLFESSRDCGWPLRRVMDQVAEAGAGVIVVLRNYDTARDIAQRIQDYKWHGVEDQIPERNKAQDDDLRTIGVGAQILADLGVRKMRVMSAPKHLHALAGFDLEVVEFVDTD